MNLLAIINLYISNRAFSVPAKRRLLKPARLNRLTVFLPAVLFCAFLIAPLQPSYADIIVTPPPARNCDIDIDDISNGPPDPGTPGPFTIVHTEYNFGDSAANLPNFDAPVEFRAWVTYPQELSCGPFPIVFILHGGHATCITSDNAESQHWPCTDQETVLPNYRGYDYLADRLASQGIIAVSISANGINGSPSTKNFSLDARAELIHKHITLWKSLAATGAFPFGDLFSGKVDLSRIGLMGHSRGGGGVARYLDFSKELPIGALISATTPNFLKTKVKAVLLLSAVAGDDQTTLETPDTALATVYPYCDGDQEDLSSVAYYDASRYALSGDNQPKHSFLILGANHNYFNTQWDETLPMPTPGSKDDWDFTDDAYCDKGNPANSRLSSAQQRASLMAVGSAFFRTYLKNEKAFLPFLRAETGPPPSAQADIHVGYHPKDAPENRLDVNRLTGDSNLTTNTLGGPVSHGGLARFEFCDASADDGPAGCLTDVQPAINFNAHRPHDFSEAPATQLRIAWDGNGGPEKPAFINELPEGKRDVSAYKAFQFRAFVDYSDPINSPGVPQNLRVALRDGAGLSTSVPVADFSQALYFPPSESNPATDDPIPRAMLNTVRVPLSAFQNIFLTDIRRVDLIFDQTRSGAINVADLAFADETANKPPQVDCSLAETQLDGGGNKLTNAGLSATVIDDHDQNLPAEVLVYSDEDDVNSNPHQYSPDARDIAPITLRLREENDKNGDGRVYLVLVKAHDSQGEIGHACCTATVPAGKSQPAIDQANVQAAETQAMCTAFAAASEGLKSLPNGFFMVGDGPVIGNDQ